MSNSVRDFWPRVWKISPPMKTIHLLCALGLFAAVAIVQAEDAGKEEKPSAASPGFTDPAKLTEKAPETFKAQFDTTKGKFTIEVTRSLAPNGADRFYNLVRSGYFKDVAFFRVVPGFMCQFGIHGDPNVSAKWREATIPTIPSKAATRAAPSPSPPPVPTRAPHSCSSTSATTRNLDGMGFSPFGKVTEGMDVVDKINGEYGDGPPQGSGAGSGPRSE